MIDKNNKNKSIIILGGDGDIGFGCLKKLTELGYKNLAVIDKKNSHRNFYKKNNILFFKSNLLKDEEIEIIFKKIKKKFYSFNILINCIGKFSNKKITEISKKNIDEIFYANVYAPTLAIKYFISEMIKDKGHGKIINIGSMAGVNGGIYAGVLYSMTKASIINLTKSLAKNYSKYITANCINPGPINTSMTKNWPMSIKKNIKNNLKSKNKSFGKIEDVANVCLFLISDNTNYFQGSELNINGGLSI